MEAYFTIDTMASEGMIKRNYTRHPFAERKRVVDLYEQGLGCKRIARETGLDDSMVRQWLRRYRTSGLDGLQLQREVKERPTRRQKQRQVKDAQFREAFAVYASTLEPVASITRRFRLDYKTFRYHVENFHPELVEARDSLKGNN